MTARDLLDELAHLASDLGPAIAPPGTERLLSSLTETARRLFGAQACSLALLSEDEEELVYTTASGAGADDVSGMRMPSSQGIAGWVVQSGQPVAIDDLQSDARFARDVAEGTGYVPQALLSVPVVSEERLLGVLTVLDRDTGRPGAEQDIQLLSLFADQAAIALEAARAFNSLGRVLLTALAAAAVDRDGDLAEALDAVEVLPGDRDLAELAALFADLGRQGQAERDLALRIVREVGAYTRGRDRRQGR